MKRLITMGLLLNSLTGISATLPDKYTELVDYVQPSPDQGETVTCLYVASTGVMELLANKKAGNKDPVPYGIYDLSESFLISAPPARKKGNFLELPVHRFNIGYGVHVDEWPFEAWNSSVPNQRVWNRRNWSRMKKLPLPKVKTIPLFKFGKSRWSTRVLKHSHVQEIKEALVKYRSPVLINYNDNNYWHVISIVGYDDTLPGNCYQITSKECAQSTGSFYVRDSFGVGVEVRDYDWLKIKVNTAVVVTESK